MTAGPDRSGMSERGRRVGRLVGVRAAVWLPSLAALLSVVVGIYNIGDTGVSGPLAPYIPRAVAATAGFTGALTGFLLFVSVYGLRNGYAAGWTATVLLLPLTAVQGLAQGSPVSYPLVVVSLLSLPALLLTRDAFAREFDLSATQLAALGAIVGAQAYGTVGTYVMREQFDAVETALDAFYYTLVTASTVGYGDAVPTTQAAKAFGLSVVVIGTASFAAALGTLIAPAIEKRLANALGTMTSDFELLEDHVIVVGIGDVTAPIVEELADEGRSFVVVSRDADRAARLRETGVDVVVADPSDEEPLRRVGVDRARALVAATNEDAQDAMAILTARELNRELNIVAAATERENVKKLKRAGADSVVSPATIGGHLLVQSALGQRGVEEVAEDLAEEGADPRD